MTLFYEGILSPNGWSDALHKLARVTGSHAASLVMWNRQQDRALVGEQVGLPPEMLAEYAQGFQAIDTARDFVDKIELGGWYMDERHLGSGSMRKSPFYQEFLKKYDADSTMASPFLRSESQIHGFLSLSGSAGRRDMGRIASRLSPLMPHLQQAGRLRVKLLELAQQASITAQVLDRFRFPLIAVTPTGRVVLANEAGERWLKSSDCPMSMYSYHAGKIRGLIDDACGLGKPPRASGHRFNKSNGASYSLIAIPLSAASTVAWQVLEPNALLVVNDPALEAPPGASLLKQMFQLTPAEIRLLSPLQNGLTLRESVEQLNISVETGRSQLKSVFGKLGVKRQADLQRLLQHLSIVT